MSSHSQSQSQSGFQTLLSKNPPLHIYTPPPTTTSSSSNHAPPSSSSSSSPLPLHFKYGTSGLRTTSTLLPSSIITIAHLLATISNRFNVSTGLMITASHNTVMDNGVKISIGETGGMPCREFGDMCGSLCGLVCCDVVRRKELVDVMCDMDCIREYAITSSKLNEGQGQVNPVLHIGWDTRPSSSHLAYLAYTAALTSGIREACVHLHQGVSTPMVHYFVWADNQNSFSGNSLIDDMYGVGRSGSGSYNETYYNNLSNGYLELLYGIKTQTHPSCNTGKGKRRRYVYVDCSMGVGAFVLHDLNQAVLRNFEAFYSSGGNGNGLTPPIIVICNSPITSKTTNTNANANEINEKFSAASLLNLNCGAEHVQKGLCAPLIYNIQLPPNDNDGHGGGGSGGGGLHAFDQPIHPIECVRFHEGWIGSESRDNEVIWCSLDGDADRIVFHSYTPQPSYNLNLNLNLIDGDRLTCLITPLLQKTLLNLPYPKAHLITQSKLKFGIVQTGYANSSSTSYLLTPSLSNPHPLSHEQVGVAATGVSYVHHECMRFDVGVYFEANGHGTVVFNCGWFEYLSSIEGEGEGEGEGVVGGITRSEKEKNALCTMKSIYKLVNQGVGDALSDLYLIDYILQLQRPHPMTADDVMSIYVDKKTRTTKLAVEDKSGLKCSLDELTLIEPSGIQDEIDSVLLKHNTKSSSSSSSPSPSPSPTVRAFLRPSGTEDVVRVFVEASTDEICEVVAGEIEGIAGRFCGVAGGRAKL